jgi:hypothetical protein
MSSAASSKAKRPPDRINKHPGAVRIINADDPHMQEAVAEWECVQAEEWETIEADNASGGNGVSLFQIGSADA